MNCDSFDASFVHFDLPQLNIDYCLSGFVMVLDFDEWLKEREREKKQSVVIFSLSSMFSLLFKLIFAFLFSPDLSRYLMTRMVQAGFSVPYRVASLPSLQFGKKISLGKDFFFGTHSYFLHSKANFNIFHVEFSLLKSMWNFLLRNCGPTPAKAERKIDLFLGDDARK